MHLLHARMSCISQRGMSIIHRHQHMNGLLMFVFSKAVGKFVWSIAAAESDSAKEEKLHALYLSNGEWNNVLLFLQILDVRFFLFILVWQLIANSEFDSESRCCSASIFIQSWSLPTFSITCSQSSSQCLD